MIAQTLTKHLKGGEIIFLRGTIGSGKTTFVQGLAKAMGTKISPVSASFVLLRSYKAEKLKLVHIDAFRLNTCEAQNLGLEEILLDTHNIIAVEWPDTAADFFPAQRLEIKISLLSGNGRKFTFTAIGKKYIELVKNYAKKTNNFSD